MDIYTIQYEETEKMKTT